MSQPLKCHAQLFLGISLWLLILGVTLLAADGRGLPAQDTTAEATVQRARQAYREAKWGPASSLFKEAANATPENVEAWLFLASCYDKLGQPDQASKAFKQAIKANPNLVIVHIHTGVDYGRLHLDEQGMETRLNALNLEPDFAAAFHSIGLAYAKLGRFPEAINAYREAIRIKPDYAEAYSNLAVAYHSQDKWGKAMQCAREAVRLDGQNAEAHFNLGVCFLKMGDRSGALREGSVLKRLGSSLSDELYTAITSGYTYPVTGSALRRPGEKD
jgi:tetratricopeptide (TPR) repeat protein